MFKKSILSALILLLLIPILFYQHQRSQAWGESITFGRTLTQYGCDNRDIRGSMSVTTTRSDNYRFTWLATIDGVAYENSIQTLYFSNGTTNSTWWIESAGNNGAIASMPMPENEMLVYTLGLSDASGQLLSQYTICIDACNTGNIVPCPESVELENDPCFTDGRINRCDAGSRIVIYPHDYENGRGLLIVSVTGENLLELLPEQVASVPECPETNTLIYSQNEVEVYRLAGSCQFQVNAPAAHGKTYVVQFA